MPQSNAPVAGWVQVLPNLWVPPAQASQLRDVLNNTAASGAAAPLAADPAYQAYLREAGFMDALDASDTRRQQDSVRSKLNYGLEDLSQEGEQTREGISGNAESRGVFRSGGRLADLARQRAGEGRNASRMIEAGGEQLADLESSLARNRIGRMTGMAERGLGTADSLYGG